MTIVLIGPPASGKTRVGKRLARRLGASFTDTDSRIVAEYGPIAEIFAREGEPYFRVIEREAVVRALETGGVISVGGGAVLDPQTRKDLANAHVVLLTVTPEAVALRIDDDKRPLVNGVDSWRALVESRMPLYVSLADYRADTSRRPLSVIVEEIATWWEQQNGENA
ncbi:shikimate kinase [Humibacter sp. RRB41]|uniref:shikimate kinase n=1 Tax=Humibacter sp. RRB41 TaxID=2919946 RepID=UPI001FA9CD03|nr:shikimate kinase [Humibacter sp. RRB41]